MKELNDYVAKLAKVEKSSQQRLSNTDLDSISKQSAFGQANSNGPSVTSEYNDYLSGRISNFYASKEGKILSLSIISYKWVV